MTWHPQRRTLVGLLLLGLLALALELATFAWGGHSTISEVAWGTDHPLVWLGLGVLIGHLAWQSDAVYRWARGEIDYLKRGGLEVYHDARRRGFPPAAAEDFLRVEGYLDRYQE